MLRITVKENALEQRWILEGRLTERSAVDLVANWRSCRDRPSTQIRIVDLNDVTSIDKSGEEVLLMMIRDGAEFVATGLYTRHLLEALKARITNCANRE
jgi:ABC-type transporter Mla MlaB component